MNGFYIRKIRKDEYNLLEDFLYEPSLFHKEKRSQVEKS